jgi:hypothetical protein
MPSAVNAHLLAEVVGRFCVGRFCLWQGLEAWWAVEVVWLRVAVCVLWLPIGKTFSHHTSCEAKRRTPGSPRADFLCTSIAPSLRAEVRHKPPPLPKRLPCGVYALASNRDSMPVISVGGENLDDVVAKQRKDHECLKRLDEFMFCMSVTNQMTTYYRTGSYGDCPALLARWRTCLKVKLSNKEDAEALRQLERRELPGHHVFLFRPDYAAEAEDRYGIPPPTPRAASGSTLPSG